MTYVDEYLLRSYHRELFQLYSGNSVDQRRINELWREIERLEAELGVEA